MRCALIIAGKEKNIFLTPETDDEKHILKAMGEGKNWQVLTTAGNFYGVRPDTSFYSVNVNPCQGGWLRGYASKESLVLGMIQEEVHEENPSPPPSISAPHEGDEAGDYIFLEGKWRSKVSMPFPKIPNSLKENDDGACN